MLDKGGILATFMYCCMNWGNISRWEVGPNSAAMATYLIGLNQPFLVVCSDESSDLFCCRRTEEGYR